MQDAASRAFGPLLERAAASERIKGVLALLKRYDSLFRLPSRIRAATKRGLYEQVTQYTPPIGCLGSCDYQKLDNCLDQQEQHECPLCKYARQVLLRTKRSGSSLRVQRKAACPRLLLLSLQTTDSSDITNHVMEMDPVRNKHAFVSRSSVSTARLVQS